MLQCTCHRETFGSFVHFRWHFSGYDVMQKKLSYARIAHTGEFCEVCETCQNQCKRLKPCVECLAFNSSKLLINSETMSSEEKSQIEANCSERCPLKYFEFVPSSSR